MIVDTSAIMAILRGEPERTTFTELIFRTPHLTMSAASRVELTAVITRSYPHLKEAAVHLLGSGSIALAPLSVTQANIASDAYAMFGRGTGHPANLNFGDCFAYALAIETGRPLLFKGNDFIHTDVLCAVRGS